MKPAPFAYHDPTSIDEVVHILAEHGDDARVLAGGQSLVPLMAMRMSRTDHLIDLNRVPELVGVTHEGDRVRIGAMTRQADIEHDPVIARHVPLLARATPLIGHFQIRNRGTIGGSLAHADPAAEYPAVMAALDATFELRSTHGTRRLGARNFFKGMWTTAIAPGEILVAVEVPAQRPGTGVGIEEVARRHGDFAMVGAAVRLHVQSDTVDECAIALFGVAGTPIRAGAAEMAALGPADRIDPAALGAAAVADLEPVADVHAGSAYRRRVGAVVARNALITAVEEATSG